MVPIKHFIDLIRPVVDWITLAEYEGLENLPKHKPYILAPNHVSFPDAWLFANAALARDKRPVRFLAHNDFWVSRGWTRFVGKFIGVLFIDWRQPAEVLERAKKVLAENDPVGIFPEGSRNYDPRITLLGKTGAVRLALLAGVPIIPAGYIGPKVATFREFLKNFVYRRNRAKLVFGKPFDLSSYRSKRITRALLHELTDRLMIEIGRLSKRKPILHTSQLNKL